jgi:ferredoxin
MIKVDKEKCMGCGLCPLLCPEIFELNSEGKAEVISQKKDPRIKEAIEQCTEGAISK